MMSWRRFSACLNDAGIKTHRGKVWSVTDSSVHVVIKRMSWRTGGIERIEEQKVLY